MALDFSRCRDVWVPDDSGGHWNPPPPHVRIGVEAIVAHPFFLLADDMGGAKSAQTIIAAQFLSEAGVIDRLIVVCPASVRPVWFDRDIGQLAEHLWTGKRADVHEFHARTRSWVHEPDGVNSLHVIVTNYEYIRSAANRDVLERFCGPKTMLVLDESTSVKGRKSHQTDACMRLRWQVNARGVVQVGRPRCGRILLLNGTPVADSPLDLFSQGNLMSPSILDCLYITKFKARYAVMAPVLGAGGRAILDPRGQPVQVVERWTNLEDLQHRFAPYVLRREAKDLGIDFALPPVALPVTLTPTTWKIYKAMRDEMVVWLRSDVASASTAAIKSLRLAQITSGFLGGVEQEATLFGVEPGLLESLDLGDYDEISGRQDTRDNRKDHGTDRNTPQAGYGSTTHEYRRIYLPRTETEEPLQQNTRENLQDPGVQEVGREKLDFALAWHAELLERDPNVKLLVWCRFVPELRRLLGEVFKARFNANMKTDKLRPEFRLGAVCGQPMINKSVREDRKAAMELLHPKTAPVGPVLVGGTYGTGALGVNFTACRTVLDMSYDFSPWRKKQGDARVNRPGQTGPVSFYYLMAVGPQGQATIDKHIILHRMGKQNVNDWTAAAWCRALMEE